MSQSRKPFSFRDPAGLAAGPGHVQQRRSPAHCLGAMLVAAVALGPACDTGPRGHGRTVDANARYGGTLVIAGPADLDQANPLVTADAWTQEVNRFLLFTTLLRYGSDLSLEPSLAESWTIHGDTAATFELRNDVRWHDGERTTAYDVQFTFERAIDPETTYPNAGYFAAWTGVEAIDSFTVRVRFRPHADPLAGTALLPIAPAHLLDSIPAERLRTTSFNKHPVGNGPFRFVSQNANDRWMFEANRDYPAALGGRPLVDMLVWRVVPDRQAQVAELLTGNAHVILIPPAESFTELSARPGIHAIVRPSFKYSFLGWNGKRVPFGDARVRRALTMAIDRAVIIEVLRGGRGEIAVGPVHPNHWAFDTSLEPVPFDPQAATALLAEAGVRDRDGDGALERPDGAAFAFELQYQAGNDFSRNAVEMIQADLAAIGVRARPRPTDWNTLVAAVSSTSRDFDAVLMGWEADFRIDLRDLFHSAAIDGPFQLASYRNPRVDHALDRAATLVDRTASLPIWHEIQRLLRDDQPWTFLYYYPDLILASERTSGVAMDIRGVLASAPHWRLTSEPTLAGNGAR
jgi:peptide/nickel transport system substrate-binding protein